MDLTDINNLEEFAAILNQSLTFENTHHLHLDWSRLDLNLKVPGVAETPIPVTSSFLLEWLLLQ